MKSIFLYLAFIQSIFLFACQGNGRYPDVQQGKLPASMSSYEFIDIEGTRHLLKDIKGTYKLLIFYDPREEQSQQEIAAMKQSLSLANLIASDKVKVLAICAGGDLSGWNTYKDHIPAQWTNGFDVKGETRTNTSLAVSTFPTLVLCNEKGDLIKKVRGHHALIQLLEH